MNSPAMNSSAREPYDMNNGTRYEQHPTWTVLCVNSLIMNSTSHERTAPDVNILIMNSTSHERAAPDVNSTGHEQYLGTNSISHVIYY
jgi:hypothetical protein